MRPANVTMTERLKRAVCDTREELSPRAYWGYRPYSPGKPPSSILAILVAWINTQPIEKHQLGDPSHCLKKGTSFFVRAMYVRATEFRSTPPKFVCGLAIPTCNMGHMQMRCFWYCATIVQERASLRFHLSWFVQKYSAIDLWHRSCLHDLLLCVTWVQSAWSGSG